MAKFKATSNVVFVVDGKETHFDENVEYDMEVKTAEELNAKGATNTLNSAHSLNVLTKKKKQQRRISNTAFFNWRWLLSLI